MGSIAVGQDVGKNRSRMPVSSLQILSSIKVLLNPIKIQRVSIAEGRTSTGYANYCQVDFNKAQVRSRFALDDRSTLFGDLFFDGR